jgi:predicted ATPase
LNARGQRLIAIAGMELPSLGSDGAQTTAISPLLEEMTQSSAVELFAQRARWVCSDFALTAGNWHDVVRICRLVDGMPLGIELAAA